MKQRTDQFMWLGNTKENKIAFVWLFVISVVFYVMNVWTPLFLDDYFYCFFFKTNVRISSLCDVLKSQYLHYFEQNGRFIPHFFAQYIEGVLGKSFFNVVNTIVFITFLYVLAITVDQKKTCFYKIITISIASIFLFIPSFGESILWMTGSFNYLWTALAVLLFNILLQKNHIHPVLYPILFLAGIICGWTHEGFMIGLCAAYFVYYCQHSKELSGSKIVLLFGLFIGCTLLVFSPGSLHRVSTDFTNYTIGDWIHSYKNALLAFRNLRLPFVLILILIIMYWKQKEYAKKFFSENQVWFIALVVSFLFVWFTRFTLTRSRFSLEFFSLIILLRLIVRINIPSKILHGMNVAVFLFILTICHVCLQNYQVHEDVACQIKTGKNVVYRDKMKCNNLFHRFILNLDSWPVEIHLWTNKLMRNYYDNPSLTVLPSILFRYSVYENEDLFYTEKDYPYYIKKVDNKDVTQVVYHLSPTDFSALPFYIRPFSSLLDRYTITSLVCHQTWVVEIDKDYHLLIVEKNEAVNNRVERISISNTETTVEYPFMEVNIQ